MHMGHHLCWPLYKSEPKQSLHLTFHRLWPNKFLVIISATTFGGLGNKQWIYLIWLQWDLNWALVSIVILYWLAEVCETLFIRLHDSWANPGPRPCITQLQNTWMSLRRFGTTKVTKGLALIIIWNTRSASK